MHNNGRVPMFKMRPHRGTLILSICVLALGVLFYLQGKSDPGNLPAHRRAEFILTLSIVISGLLFILATARMWFKHLWHDRYK